MTTALILIASGILIGAGIGVIWRDVKRTRRRAFVLQREAQGTTEPEVEIVISRNETETPRPQATARKLLDRLAANGHAKDKDAEEPTKNKSDTTEPSAPDAGLPLERQWLVLTPILDTAIGKVNAVLAPVKLAIAPSGEPSWSYKNAGYGAHRRLMLGEESIGWLRLELTSDGRFTAVLKAHKDDIAEINGSAETATASLNAAHMGDILSRCLEPAARYAAQAAGGTIDEKQLSETAWKAVEPLVIAALKATNGALLQAGGRLVPVTTPTWQDELKRHRMTLAVEVESSDVGRMHIERVAHEVEVAVGVADQRLIELGRRRRIAIEGMTIHALAELIASCAWPTIARSRETRRQADR
jgi:hypothetical protein